MEKLSEMQKQLDEKKYYSSLIGRTDMSGKMEFCKNCIFKNDKKECEIPHEHRKEFCICARQYFKDKEKENESKQPRKRNNGKS